MAGMLVLQCGYGDVGVGCAVALHGTGGPEHITGIDPIRALLACMEGSRMVALELVLGFRSALPADVMSAAGVMIGGKRAPLGGDGDAGE
eukprot:9542052-Lingulodinium_polyedra.AAC.1